MEALEAAAARNAGSFTFYMDDGPVSFGAAELYERAHLGARRLAARGVEPGDPVGILGPNHPEWVVWAFATWLAGATVVPIQIPLRVRDPAAFAEQLQILVETARCRLVISDPRLVGSLPGGVGVGWSEEGDASSDELVAAEPDGAAVTQFTSGSTAMPKGALLPHSAVMAQMDILYDGCHRGYTPRSILSWTPFFHDLGLFYNIVQVVTWGLASHHLPTERFARDPVEWLRLVESTRVNSTVAPSSAFGSSVRSARKRGEKIDLSQLEAAYFAAEGVDPEVVQGMVELAGDFGFRPEALGSTYGLAEAVMAVSYPPVGSGMRMERVSLDELAGAGVATPSGDTERSRLMVGCGPPRMEVRIAGPEGDLAERHVGEILVRGPSLMRGYVGVDVPDPFDEGWLRTGDMGYLADGEIYITGRARDMVIVMGHNYYPEDFEWAAARHESVRPGRCVAISKPGTEEVVVLVEPHDGADSDEVARGVERAVMNAVGIAPRDVVVLAPGTVEKTTSGKLRRAAMRKAYSSGSLA